MRALALLVVVVSVIVHPARAWAQETLGVLHFTAPEGWERHDLERSVELVATDADTGAWGKVRVWGTTASHGSPSKDFKDDYDTLVVRAVHPKQAPKTRTTDLAGGWKRTEARAAFTFAGHPGAAVLYSFSDGKHAATAVALWSGDAFQEAAGAFLASITLAAPAAEDAPQSAPSQDAEAAPAPAARFDARLLGRWSRRGSSAPHYADPASWGTSGYTASRYEFRPDGTYTYTERSWRPSHAHILLVKESGAFVADAGTITVQPTASVIEAYTKKGGADELGARVESKRRPPERATYRYAFHYFQGLQLWNLVLQADQPTLRDGPFSANTTYPNAWYFDQRFAETELTSPRGK